jgi:hypothetical protein
MSAPDVDWKASWLLEQDKHRKALLRIRELEAEVKHLRVLMCAANGDAARLEALLRRVVDDPRNGLVAKLGDDIDAALNPERHEAG